MNMLMSFAEYLVVFLLLIGGFFSLVGSFGLARLSDFYKRLHGPTKATTLGVGCILIASIWHHATLGDGLGLREVLVAVFLFITAPISAHLMAKAALAQDPGRPRQPPVEVAMRTTALPGHPGRSGDRTGAS
jgi:multicomponent K+:H+ antiporter subunit G